MADDVCANPDLVRYEIDDARFNEPQRWDESYQEDDGEALETWRNDNFAQWEDELDGNQIDALEGYSRSHYGPINKALRTGDPHEIDAWSHDIANIDSALELSVLPEDMIVYRGVSGSAADSLTHARVGSIFEDAGFMSTSQLAETAEPFAAGAFSGGPTGGATAMMEIFAPSGHPGAAAMMGSFDQQEYEILFARNTRFLIRGFKEDGTILVEVLP